ncbi:MAG: hypothetical protein ACRC30_14775 [Clostridium sp.]
MNNDKKCCSTSPQITTKVSEHGNSEQLSNLMQKESTPDNLSNCKCTKECAENCSSNEDYTSAYLENSTPVESFDKISPDSYLPNEGKTDYCPTNGQLTSVSESGGRTKATDPTIDDIAVNNIATSEFNTTEDIETK